MGEIKKMILDRLRKKMPQYCIEIISEKNIDDVFALLRSNVYFYSKTQEHNVTRQECIADITALPPGIEITSKTYIAVYQEEKCIAVIDFIEGYPNDKTGYLGLFILDASVQGHGIGKNILNYIMEVSKEIGFEKIELACHKSNEKGFLFWSKMRFYEVRRSERETDRKKYVIISMQHKLC